MIESVELMMVAARVQCFVCLALKDTHLRHVGEHIHHVCRDCESSAGTVPDASDLRNLQHARSSGDAVREAGLLVAAEGRYFEWKAKKASALVKKREG
jgi:hypothetical protein